MRARSLDPSVTVERVTADNPQVIRRIPFNRPVLMGRELEYMAEALHSGHASGDGPFTDRAQALLESITGARTALLTPSCTHALELAAHLLDVGPGDEVIVPSFTFPSTANAFVLRGARIVFADVRADTLNIDAGELEALITPRTRAIAVVHYGGVGCEMDAIQAIASANSLAVVEDNAHGLFGSYGGRNLGTFGELAALSFHETKNVSCGEGGALLINDERFIERAEIVREKGTDRSRFFRGQVDKYTWVDIGSSYVLSDLLAAHLLAQLEARAEIQRRRRAVWDRYRVGLEGWADRRGATLPHVPERCEQSYHLFYVLLRSEAERNALIEHLRARGVFAVFHYVPLHSSAMGRRFGADAADCPVSDDVSRRLVRLPFYNDLTSEDQERVIAAMESWRA